MSQLSNAQFQILLSLADGAKHGYAIMQDVNDMPGNRTRLGPGTLYGNLKKMLAKGLVIETEEVADDQRRRTYRLSEEGRRVVSAEAERIAALVAVARSRQLLQEGA